jgi:hypothetical protein
MADTNKRKTMTVDEYERMTNRPYKSKFNSAYYDAGTMAKVSGGPGGGGYTYTGEGASNKAGAGRGGQGGPTAQEFKDANMSTAEKNARQDILEEKYTKKTKDQDYAKGGTVGSASKRADGIATKGKTKGRFI